MVLNVGDRVPGTQAIVLASMECEGNYRVVLAKWDDNITPYVTWRIESTGCAYWGHYHKTYEAARKNFLERIEMVMTQEDLLTEMGITT